jgi:hypothetical protein
MTGSREASRIVATSTAVGIGSGNRLGERVAEWPPAAQPWTASMSTPAPVAARASAAFVTVAATTLPRDRSEAMT